MITDFEKACEMVFSEHKRMTVVTWFESVLSGIHTGTKQRAINQLIDDGILTKRYHGTLLVTRFKEQSISIAHDYKEALEIIKAAHEYKTPKDSYWKKIYESHKWKFWLTIITGIVGIVLATLRGLGVL